MVRLKRDAADVVAACEDEVGFWHDTHPPVVKKLEAHGTGTHVLLAAGSVQAKVGAPAIVLGTGIVCRLVIGDLLYIL